MMRRERAKRGEMLIETIVAFAVLMVLLTMVTTVVRGAIALNNRATERLNALAADCVTIESSNYAGNIDGALTLELVTTESSDVAVDTITENLKIFAGSELRVFHLQIDDGTSTSGSDDSDN